MHKSFYTCAEAARLISESMDRPLPPWERARLRVHVWLCQQCDRYQKQLLIVREALRRRPDRQAGAESAPSGSGPSPETRATLLQAFRNRPK